MRLLLRLLLLEKVKKLRVGQDTISRRVMRKVVLCRLLKSRLGQPKAGWGAKRVKWDKGLVVDLIQESELEERTRQEDEMETKSILVVSWFPSRPESFI